MGIQRKIRISFSYLLVACAMFTGMSLTGTARAQSSNLSPSLLSPGMQSSPLVLTPGTLSPGTSLINPKGNLAETTPPMTLGPAVGLAGPSGQFKLALSARYGKKLPPINAALYWRVYSDSPGPDGQVRLVTEEQNPSPIFTLAPGGYIIHVNFGLASAVRHIQLRTSNAREIFDIAAGGGRFEGRVGEFRISPDQISFDLYKGSQFDPGEKQQIARNIQSGDVVLVPEGIYHIVSNYGDGNAVVRSDLRIQAGKLTDTVIVHRAARITLKLVNERGGEAIANTAWSVLTPGGDVIKESIGAFPVVILSEGDYIAIARNEGKVHNREFRVESGIDREIEVLVK